MSLLEDVFLQDEAGEAQELERIIEGGEYDDRPHADPHSDDNSEEGEAEEDKRRVDPSAKAKRVVKNPRSVLNPARLTGPRGIQVIPEHFKDLRFKGKGHEKEDLDVVLKKLEHWAYRLYPKFKFDDCLKKIETLGRKRPVMVHLQKIRSDQFVSEETVVQKDSSDEEQPEPVQDEFDVLLQEQIDLARTPGRTPVSKISPLILPKAISSPSISDEQRERMMRNRQMAEERRLAKLKNSNKTENNDSGATVNLIDDVVKEIGRKKNKFNVIDSSDEEVDLTVSDQPESLDTHGSYKVIDMTDVENTYGEVNMQKQSKNKIGAQENGRKKINKSYSIDSSDEEVDLTVSYQPKSVDAHDTNEPYNVMDMKDNENIYGDINVRRQSPNVAIEIVRKKVNKSNVINSSDEEVDLIIRDQPKSLVTNNSNNVIDMTNVKNTYGEVNLRRQSKNKHDGKKILNKSNSIESSAKEDLALLDQAKYIVTHDTYDSNNVTDFRDVNVCRNSKNKTNNLDSSDDEIDLTVIYYRKGKEITIKTNKTIDNTEVEKNNQDVVNLTGENNLNGAVIDISKPQDVQNNDLKYKRKLNNPKHIDSSDDECDLTSVNQPVTVDIHQHNIFESQSNNIVINSKEKDQDSDEIVDEDKDVTKDRQVTSNCNSTEKISKHNKENLSSDRKDNKTADNTEKEESKDSYQISTNKLQKVAENGCETDFMDDLMDVDFGDEF